MNPEIKNKALSIYSPPFTYKRGYIWDSAGNMFADDGECDIRSTKAVRVRGWGRIGYMGEGAPKIQDAVGELIAQAMTEYWEKNQ